MIHIRSFLYLLTCKILHAKYYNRHEAKQEFYLVQTRSQAKPSDTLLPKLHSIGKGVDSNLKAEKQVVNPLSTPVQSHVAIWSKSQTHESKT